MHTGPGTSCSNVSALSSSSLSSHPLGRGLVSASGSSAPLSRVHLDRIEAILPVLNFQFVEVGYAVGGGDAACSFPFLSFAGVIMFWVFWPLVSECILLSWMFPMPVLIAMPYGCALSVINVCEENDGVCYVTALEKYNCVCMCVYIYMCVCVCCHLWALVAVENRSPSTVCSPRSSENVFFPPFLKSVSSAKERGMRPCYCYCLFIFELWCPLCGDSNPGRSAVPP